MRRALVLAHAAAALVACGKERVRPRASAAAPSASIAAAPDAGAPIELLHAVPSIVAVSSRVDNPRDLPDFIVDGKPETAWNGRTGDLVGGYVAFRVPKDARVDFVKLQVGYDRKTDKEDLFTANVRIKAVRVFRDRKLLMEKTLDPDVREPQRIDVGAGGGDFKLEVKEIAPGTKASWRELVVSELSVWGKPGAQLLKKPHAPPVRVGGLDPSMPTIEHPKRAATLEAACRAFEKDRREAFAERKADFGSNPWGDSDTFEARCAPGAAIAGPKTSFVSAVELDAIDEHPFYYNQHFEGAVLGVKTSNGAFATEVPLRGKERAVYWTTEYETLSVASASSAGRDALAIQVVERRVTDSDGAGTPEELHSETVTHHGTICDLDAQGALTCRTTSTDLVAKLRDRVEPSPLRTTANGELVFDVAGARR